MESNLEEQRKLATIIKEIHQELRNSAQEVGAEEAWSKHLENRSRLELYAASMRKLSEKHWRERNSAADDRIEWIIKSCEEYFQDTVIQEHRRRDLEILEKINSERSEFSATLPTGEFMKIGEKLKVVDCGSSGNFFKRHTRFEILPIDIAPSSPDVFYCDFLSVPVASSEIILDTNTRAVESLPVNHFDVVIFCLLLEYIPSSDMRIKCCQNAYEILRTEGVLCIITPDSCYQHTNAQQIKTWKYTLAKIGFQRIKMEKLTNLRCMVFRKSLSPEVPRRWAELKKEPYMEFRIDIPQDRRKADAPKESGTPSGCEFSVDMMNELPFE